MFESDYDPNLVKTKRDQFVLISGCSGGGKSSLLSELARRGYRTYAEPGRQIIKEQQQIGGDALPWADWRKFIDLAMSRSMHNIALAAQTNERAFFDRGIVDAVTAFRSMKVDVPAPYLRAVELYRYDNAVFLAPPWPEIFHNDAERKHSFETATAEYEAVRQSLAEFGYSVIVLPKSSVASRADFVISQLA